MTTARRTVNDALHDLRVAMDRKRAAKYPRTAKRADEAPARNYSEPDDPRHDMTDWLKPTDERK